MSDVPPRIDPVAVRSAQFQGSFRKYDSKAVDQYLEALADQLAKVNNYIDELERQVSSPAVTVVSDASPAPESTEKPSLRTLSDDEIATMVGEETAHVLSTARKAAEEIRSKAEDAAARMIRESTDEATSLIDKATEEAAELRGLAETARDDAVAKAEAEALEIIERAAADADRRVTEARAMADDELVRAEKIRAEAGEEAERVRSEAREEGRAMLAEAKEVRTRVLEDLQRRRDIGRSQIERLMAGRDRLLEAYATVRANVDDMTAELEHVLDEPFDHDPALEEGFVGIVTTTAPPKDDEEPAAVEPDEETEDIAEAGEVDEPEAPQPPEVDAAEPEPEPAPEASLGGEPEPEPESDAAPGPAAPASAGEPEVDVDALFARMRADREQSVARAQAVLGDAEVESPDPVEPEAAVAEADEAGSSDGGGESTDIDAVPAEYLASGDDYEHRTTVLTAANKTLSRALKRLLADEQNEVLDAVRRTESTVLDDVLPALDDHVGSYATVSAAILTEVATAAATHLEPAAGDVDVSSLGSRLGSAVVEPLRRRIERAAADVDGDHDELDERLRSLYREWKVEQIGRQASDALVSAYAEGQLSVTTKGDRIRWLIDPATGPCPDCQDNALEGPIPAGDAFPTGDRRPQAHPGCSCMLAVVAPEPAG